MSPSESKEMIESLQVKWDAMSHGEQMHVLYGRILSGMEAYEMTPAEAYQIWNAGCAAMFELSEALAALTPGMLIKPDE